MNTIRHIGAKDVAGKIDWTMVTQGLRAGHKLARAQLGDQVLRRQDDTLLSRAAWIDGLGVGVKSVTVMAGNRARDLPSVQGAMLVFDDATGRPEALIDSDVLTYWKTAGDSVLGALLLVNPAPRRLLILGAGVVAESLIHAYGEVFSCLEEIHIWNRTRSKAEALAGKACDQGFAVKVADDLAGEVAVADIVCTATMALEPVLLGEWVKPGIHVDLIGAFKTDMREADDALLKKARLFVDSRDTTLDHIGELTMPLASGAITRDDVLGDLYDLVAGSPGRMDESDITVFKNGGGGHLDLMTAQVILDASQ